MELCVLLGSHAHMSCALVFATGNMYYSYPSLASGTDDGDGALRRTHLRGESPAAADHHRRSAQQARRTAVE